jgi:hypothetical protein
MPPFFLYPFLLYRTLMVSKIFIFLCIYTQSVGLLGRVIDPSQGLYLNTGQHKHRKTHARTHTHQTYMPEVGFEHTITASERAKRVHALDRSATGTGQYASYNENNSCCKIFYLPVRHTKLLFDGRDVQNCELT